MHASVKCSAFAFTLSLIALFAVALYAIWMPPSSYPPVLGKASLTAGLVLASTAFHIAVYDAWLRIKRNSQPPS